MLTAIQLIVLLIAIAWIWYTGRHPENPRFPKGPFFFPLFGTLPHFHKGILSLLISWRKEYGKMVGLKMGSFRVVLINDYDLIKEAFNEKVFSGRPSLPVSLAVGLGKKRGLVPSEGKVWEEQRRFCLRHLRNFHFEKHSMEVLIHEYAQDIVNSFAKENGKPINTVRRFKMAGLGAVWKIVAGQKIDIDDIKFQRPLDTLQTTLESVSLNNVGMVIPWTIKLAPGLIGWKRFLKNIGSIQTFIGGQIEEHKKTFQEDNICNLMDSYLSKIKETSDSSSSFYKEEGEMNMLVSCVNLFFAGAETTNMTMNWALFLLALNKDVQIKLYDEISSVVGNSRLPSSDDITKMPYTEAVMMETFRLSSIVPVGIFHNTMEDVEFHGHFFPKDTIVCANIYGLHLDPAIWGKDAQDFRPERFLNSEGKLSKEVPPIMPFSIGKRACIGENLARAEIFVFLTSLCQRFEFTLDPSCGKPDITGMSVIFRKLPQFQLIFEDRLRDF